MDEMTSPHSVRDPDSEMREIFVLGNSESGKILLEKSGILGSGIWSKVQGIRIPVTNEIQNPSFTDKDWDPVPGIHNSLRGNQNPRLVWISFHGTNEYRPFVKILRKCEDTYLVQNLKISFPAVFLAWAQK